MLDLAAGTGASLLPAARRVGATGRVIDLDLAPGTVDRLRELIARLGLEVACVLCSRYARRAAGEAVRQTC